MNKLSTTIIMILIIFLISMFLGYTYYSDAEAIQKIYSEVETINQISTIPPTITFVLNITNPTPRDINQLSSNFDIYIEDKYIGKGSFTNLSIPAQTHIFEQVTITFDYDGLADSVKVIINNWVNEKKTKLIIKGSMEASVFFGLLKASHSFTAST